MYGSYFDWNEKGEFCPWDIEDPEDVDKKRRKMGLSTLEERIKEMHEDVMKNNLSPPKNHFERQSEMNLFLREVGWIA